MAKLSALTTIPGGVEPGDYVYVVRGDGASPETFTSYKALIDKLLAYDFGCAFADTPTAGSVIQRVRIGRDITIPANMAGSSGGVQTNPAATWAIDVQDDGVSIGTISVSTGGVVTFTTAGSPAAAQNVAAGSEITFVAPVGSPPEATVADGSFVIVATQA